MSEISAEEMDAIYANLADPEWRLNNLYYITDKDGREIKFKPNLAQQQIYDNLGNRNAILKSRQLGVTTWSLIFMLDSCIFRPDTHCVMICHNRDDAAKLFEEKAKYAWERMPKEIKSLVKAVNNRAGELKFSNGSSLTCSTSARGSTLRILHVSEMAAIDKEPLKAREVITGAMESVSKDGIIIVESTAWGNSGYFFDICQQAEKNKLSNKRMSIMDWHFFFFPWDLDPSYTLDVGDEITQRIKDYFKKLSAITGKTYSEGQQRFYMMKERTLGEDMKKEYPSTSDEAFEVSIRGAFYDRQFTELYEKNQITKVPHDRAASVSVFFDLGVNDTTALWFVQILGRGEIHIIDFYENSGEGLLHYIDVINQKKNELGYQYYGHFAPHDIMVREWGADGKSRFEQAKAHGIHFEVVPRLPVADGIEAVRTVLPNCWFDFARCEQGIKHLQGYRKQWDERNGVWRDRPLHNECSNAADAFRYFAVSTNLLKNDFHNTFNFPTQQPLSSRAWT